MLAHVAGDEWGDLDWNCRARTEGLVRSARTEGLVRSARPVGAVRALPNRRLGNHLFYVISLSIAFNALQCMSWNRMYPFSLICPKNVAVL